MSVERVVVLERGVVAVPNYRDRRTLSLSNRRRSGQAIDHVVHRPTARSHRAVRSHAVVVAQPHVLTNGAVEDQVSVRLDEARNDHAVLVATVDGEVATTQIPNDVGFGADVEDPTVTDRNRRRRWTRWVHGVNGAGSEDGRHHSSSCAMMLRPSSRCWRVRRRRPHGCTHYLVASRWQ